MPLSIGKTVRMLREAKRLSLGAAAKATGISVPFLSLIEADQRNPSMNTLKALASALDVPADLLILIASGQPSSLASKEGEVDRLLQVLERVQRVEKELQDAIDRKAG